MDGPRLYRLKTNNLFFAVAYHQKHCRLYATGREALGNFFPQNGRDFITHPAIKHATRLLGVYFVHIYRRLVFDSCQNSGFGNFVKGNTIDLRFITYRLCDLFTNVPCNYFALTVRVACQVHFLNLLCLSTNFFDDLSFIFNGIIFEGNFTSF